MTDVKDSTEEAIFDVTLLSESLLDSVEEFDRATLPLGLYASEEYRAKEGEPRPRLFNEWTLCLAPCLTLLGYTPVKVDSRPGTPSLRDGQFRFGLPDRRSGTLTVVKPSKVKVRRFGSAYRLDPHHDFKQRWDALRLERRLPDLWRPSLAAEEGSNLGLCLFLLIGFAREADPFTQELTELEGHLEWDRPGVTYRTRFWPDREGRGFSVRLSLWAAEVAGKPFDPKEAWL